MLIPEKLPQQPTLQESETPPGGVGLEGGAGEAQAGRRQGSLGTCVSTWAQGHRHEFMSLCLSKKALSPKGRGAAASRRSLLPRCLSHRAQGCSSAHRWRQNHLFNVAGLCAKSPSSSFHLQAGAGGGFSGDHTRETPPLVPHSPDGSHSITQAGPAKSHLSPAPKVKLPSGLAPKVQASP